MYLARQNINNQINYYIRQSIVGPDCIRSRDLFDLGTDPRQFIVYPGGNSYYFDSCIEESLREQGLAVNQHDLDAIFLEFLAPETQRVIAGFDRGSRQKPTLSAVSSRQTPHLFDKRRYHYLRFGSRNRQHIDQVPAKVFRPLMDKSRDELEHYFLAAERILRPAEIFNYLTVIFGLKQFKPDSDAQQPLIEQLDTFFTDRLCRLNDDASFKSGVPDHQGLYEHLARYAVMYFDTHSTQRRCGSDNVKEFMNRHRAYVPPRKVRVSIREAEQIFGHSWKELRRMDRPELTRIYRQLALKHHPDQGGQADAFQRLTEYYRALTAKK